MWRTIGLLIAFYILSCGNSKIPIKTSTQDPLEEKFKPIEKNLETFAKKHRANISTSEGAHYIGDSGKKETIHTKLIEWTDGPLRRAIIIQPYSDLKGIDSMHWNFFGITWRKKDEPSAIPKEFRLAKKVRFEEITNNIDSLLMEADKKFEAVREEDFRNPD